MFPQSYAYADLAIESDHKSVVLKLERPRKKKRKVFRFEAKWLLKDECHLLINDNWGRDSDRHLVEKLAATRNKLKEWSAENL